MTPSDSFNERMDGLEDLPPNAPKSGDLFADRYRIDRVLGVGGMGYVLAAEHLQLRARVAIKMLLPSLAGNGDTVERFLREGRAAVNIRSEHVARILDVAELPDKTPYIVMEYLEGADLSKVLRDRGRVLYRDAVDWLLEACEAIAEAHAMRVVHRDLKPANLFLARRPSGEQIVKVLDFGISKIGGLEGNLAITKTATMLGSPLYMSPEQLKSSRNVDDKADIWAIGVILYELITGAPPFMAETLAELGALVLGGDAPRLIDQTGDVPVALSEIVATCLQKKSQDRFGNLADFADAIAPFGGTGASASARTIVGLLGMPAVRAKRPVHAPNSHPNLAAFEQVNRTQVISSSSSAISGSSQSSPMMLAPRMTASRTAPSSRRNIGILLGVFVTLAAVGGGLVLMAKRTSAHHPVQTTVATPPSTTSDPIPVETPTSAAASTTAVDPPPSTTQPAVAASATSVRGPVGRTTPIAKIPKSPTTTTTPTPTQTAVSAPATTTAPPTTTKAAPIATSSKD